MAHRLACPGAQSTLQAEQGEGNDGGEDKDGGKADGEDGKANGGDGMQQPRGRGRQPPQQNGGLETVREAPPPPIDAKEGKPKRGTNLTEVEGRATGAHGSCFAEALKL